MPAPGELRLQKTVEDTLIRSFSINPIFFTVFLVLFIAGTVFASEWNLYGSARMATFYTSQDLGDLYKSDANPNGDDEFGRSTVKDLQWNLQSNARIGATVKGDTVSGRFEYGASTDPDLTGNNANIRLLYGVWHFSENWGLKVGQDYTPITFFLSGQVFDTDNELEFVGNAYGGRHGQVALEGTLGPGTLKFAAVTPKTSTLNVTSEATTETRIPKLEASYEFKLNDAISFHGFLGYNYYKLYWLAPAPGGVGTANYDKNISSYFAGLGADLNFGPFYVKPQMSYYQNGAVAGWLGTNLGLNSLLPEQTPFLNEFDNDIVDVKSLMAMLALGYSPTESLTLEAGVGYIGSKSDSYQVDPTRSVKFKNNYLECYVQAAITMASGVYLIPEVGLRDYGDVEGDVEGKVDLGSLWYAGAKWQINF